MNTHYRTIRRVTLTGPYGHVTDAINYVARNNYDRIVYSGPKPMCNGKRDMTRFRIVAEKVVS